MLRLSHTGLDSGQIDVSTSSLLLPELFPQLSGVFFLREKMGKGESISLVLYAIVETELGVALTPGHNEQTSQYV